MTEKLPIIIGGCHRSGTSLVRRILNAHSEIYCGPEIKFFRDFYEDYFDDPLKHIRFSSTARAMLSEDALFELLGAAFINIHEIAAAGAGKKRWADKNPENVKYLEQWEKLLGSNWVFVHVVRNPLDTIASMIDVGFPLTIPPQLEQKISFYNDMLISGYAFQKKIS